MGRTVASIALMALTMASAYVAVLPLSEAGQFPFSKDVYELGRLQEGRGYVFNLQLNNITDDFISIESLDVSCGCTEVRMLDNTIPPEGSGTLEVRIDTTAKSGGFVKIVDVYLAGVPEPAELTLKGFVEHSAGTVNNGALFKGSCAACHLGRPVEGKSGPELYDALCYICHKEMSGLMGTATARAGQAIANGLEGTSMPAFSKENNGPLTKEQIWSLVDMLQWKN